MTRTCPHCQAEFETENPTQTRCRSPRPRPCRFCAQPFTPKDYRSCGPEHQICSGHCAKKEALTKFVATHTCKCDCGAVFTPRDPCQLYCSARCRRVFLQRRCRRKAAKRRGKPASFVCQSRFCGKTVPINEGQGGRWQRKWCSHRCKMQERSARKNSHKGIRYEERCCNPDCGRKINRAKLKSTARYCNYRCKRSALHFRRRAARVKRRVKEGVFKHEDRVPWTEVLAEAYHLGALSTANIQRITGLSERAADRRLWRLLDSLNNAGVHCLYDKETQELVVDWDDVKRLLAKNGVKLR